MTIERWSAVALTDRLTVAGFAVRDNVGTLAVSPASKLDAADRTELARLRCEILGLLADRAELVEIERGLARPRHGEHGSAVAAKRTVGRGGFIALAKERWT